MAATVSKVCLLFVLPFLQNEFNDFGLLNVVKIYGFPILYRIP